MSEDQRKDVRDYAKTLPRSELEAIVEELNTPTVAPIIMNNLSEPHEPLKAERERLGDDVFDELVEMRRKGPGLSDNDICQVLQGVHRDQCQ